MAVFCFPKNSGQYPDILQYADLLRLRIDELGEPIGKGSFAEVFKQKNTYSECIYKVQKDRRIEGSHRSIEKVWMNEVSVLKACSHACIPKLFDHYKLDGYFYIKMEVAQGVELFDFLMDNYQFGMPHDILKMIAQQLVSAVYHLHSHRIYHLDITNDNVVIDIETRSLKLIDYGLSTTEQFIVPWMGAIDYRSISWITVLCKNTRDGTKTLHNSEYEDKWMLGTLLFTCAYGLSPRSRKSVKEYWDEVMEGKDGELPRVIIPARPIIKPKMKKIIDGLMDDYQPDLLAILETLKYKYSEQPKSKEHQLTPAGLD